MIGIESDTIGTKPYPIFDSCKTSTLEDSLNILATLYKFGRSM